MRLLPPRKRTTARTSPAGRRERVLQDILTGPDTAHRRELEILLDEQDR